MAARSKKVTNEAAAAVLRIYESEVKGVDGDVVTTSDGQRYRLTGEQPGDYVWLRGDEDEEGDVDAGEAEEA